MDKRIQWALSKLLEKVNPGFHGTITFCFRGGRLEAMKTEQTEKPEDNHTGI